MQYVLSNVPPDPAPVFEHFLAFPYSSYTRISPVVGIVREPFCMVELYYSTAFAKKAGLSRIGRRVLRCQPGGTPWLGSGDLGRSL